MAAKFSRSAPSPRYRRPARSNAHVRYEFRLAYIKGGQMKDKLLERV